MSDWQVTATTIYCDAVDADVTVIVNRDGSVKCVGMKKYHDNPTKEIINTLTKKSRKLGRTLACEGEECPRKDAYRDRIFADETKN
jgi:hypothetical protein